MKSSIINIFATNLDLLVYQKSRTLFGTTLGTTMGIQLLKQLSNQTKLIIWDALHDLAPFVQFIKDVKNTHGVVLLL